MRTLSKLFFKLTAILPIWLGLVIVYSPTLVFAQATPNPQIQKVQLINPLNNISTIPELLTAILNIVMILMVPVIVFFIIYSGFKYVTARGNASQVEEASQSLLYAIIGGVLILGAIAISQIIQNVVNAF